MILCDTSGLLALLDSGEPDHAAAHQAVGETGVPFLVTDFVLAETDYLVLGRLGAEAERAFSEQILDGTFFREPVTNDDMGTAIDICRRYADQRLGLTDATLMALADRLRCPVLTLDRRHFAVHRDKRGRALVLKP